MTNFKKILAPDIHDPTFPQVVEYKGKEIFGFDRFPIKNLDILIVSIEKTLLIPRNIFGRISFGPQAISPEAVGVHLLIS